MHKRTAIALLALVAGGALTACGDNSSTADGSGTDAASASSPTAVVPANPSTSGTVEATTPRPHSGDTGSGNGVDGSISEVTELPPAASVRDDSDDAFLKDLKGKGIDVSDQLLQDQVIAAAHEQCQANTEGHDSFSVPAVAGQLRALGATDKDPEDVASAVKAAAEKNYCK